uniref:Uncharacterized protein n=1 Tax=Amphimedon queenslandica TaxID=400682 RepID=A0A1X7TCS6_AMPQE
MELRCLPRIRPDLTGDPRITGAKNGVRPAMLGTHLCISVFWCLCHCYVYFVIFFFFAHEFSFTICEVSSAFLSTQYTHTNTPYSYKLPELGGFGAWL